MALPTLAPPRPTPRVLFWQTLRLVGLLLLCGVCLQLYFVVRVALMIVIDPQSTTFERSEIWRLMREPDSALQWRQTWVADSGLSVHLKRAVISSEDASFIEHNGVDWDALRNAWERNRRAEARAERLNQQLERRQETTGQATTPNKFSAKIIGGSTITQQLAKNLFLSGERTSLRKAQEFLITFMLEGLLSKRRILTIYLNHVEWGEGVFGAEAAAQRYFRAAAHQLSPSQAARLAVMLPAPKRFEKQPRSPYLNNRTALIIGRMGGADLP
jgi:monofunctional biosynthetic peptidoglycan transglycosylase